MCSLRSLRSLALNHAKSRLNTPVWGSLPSPNYYDDEESQEFVFFRYETKARKVMVDFKFDALYSYVFIKNL